jgi:hypothetical protein
MHGGCGYGWYDDKQLQYFSENMLELNKNSSLLVHQTTLKTQECPLVSSHGWQFSQKVYGTRLDFITGCHVRCDKE